MQEKFKSLLAILGKPVQVEQGVATDNSILVVYPPNEELNFCEHLLDKFIPELQAKDINFELLNLEGFLFEAVDTGTIEDVQEEEFEDYKWAKQGLAKRAEVTLVRQIREIASSNPGCNILIYNTVSLYPLIRFGEILREIRDANCRIVIAFPGEERGGKLHFMNQADGGNYLATKIS